VYLKWVVAGIRFMRIKQNNSTSYYTGISRYSDWLRTGRSGDRIPVGARFFAHVQTGPEAHPASCTKGTGSFSGVKRPGRGADHSPPSSAEVKKEWSYTSTHPRGLFRPLTGQLYLFYYTGIELLCEIWYTAHKRAFKPM
jgi:hypothetical protein